MKNSRLRETVFTVLSGILYGTLIPFAALSAFATAFSLHLPAAGNSFYRLLYLKDLFWTAFGFSILFSILYSVKKLWVIVPVFLFVYFGYGWQFRNLKDCTYDLFYILSKRYDNAYGCGVLMLKDTKPIYSDISVVFRGFVILGVAIISWATCKRQSSYWVLLFSLMCFAPCCALTNTVPEKWSLFLWALSILLFMISNYVRKTGFQKSLLLSLVYVIPIGLALIFLFNIVPESTYEGAERADSMLESLEDVIGAPKTVFGSSDTDFQTEVDLASLEEQKPRNIPVMYITVPETGTYYLRGQAYTTYTGTQWISQPNSELLPWSSTNPTNKKITVRTRFEHDMLYVPYCADPDILRDGDLFLENTKNIKEYSYLVYTDRSLQPTVSENFDPSYWTSLPEDTKAWAYDYILERAFSASDPSALMYSEEHFASFIAETVQSSAQYDLAPEPMDPSYTDFVRWFMEEGESGYCVHFAASATVLLRAANIPARYVTGYLVEATANRESTVYQKHSHAWVEYWTEANGWQILEATPAGTSDANTSLETEENSTNEPSTLPSTELMDTEPEAEPTIPLGDEEPTISEGNADYQPPNTEIPSTQDDSSLVWTVIFWIFIGSSFIVILMLQRKIRLLIWDKKVSQASGNERALLYWSRSLKYNKVLKQAPKQKLKQIAQKAKFSQHTITPSELEPFRAYFKDAEIELGKQSIFRRFYGKWILAL